MDFIRVRASIHAPSDPKRGRFARQCVRLPANTDDYLSEYKYLLCSILNFIFGVAALRNEDGPCGNFLFYIDLVTLDDDELSQLPNEVRAEVIMDCLNPGWCEGVDHE